MSERRPRRSMDEMDMDVDMEEDDCEYYDDDGWDEEDDGEAMVWEAAVVEAALHELSALRRDPSLSSGALSDYNTAMAHAWDAALGPGPVMGPGPGPSPSPWGGDSLLAGTYTRSH